jgi:hypothetical protein
VLCLVIGGLQVILAAFHAAVPPEPELTTLALFLIPVVHTSLNFELSGEIFTGGRATVMTLPRLAAFASSNCWRCKCFWCLWPQKHLTQALLPQAVGSKRSFRWRCAGPSWPPRGR